MERMKREIMGCVQGEDAFCSSACPFGVDIRDMAARLARGRVDAAYRIYRDAVVFPAVAGALCPAPCEKVCPRARFGGAVQLKTMERSLTALAKNKRPAAYNIPPKLKRVAVIGGGLSGLACALRLCTRKYAVTLYEREMALGGSALALLPEGLLQEELELQFSSESCEFVLGREIRSLSEIEADAYYIATGKNGSDFGLPLETGKLLFTDVAARAAAGGAILGLSHMEAIAQGARAAAAIDSLITTGYFEPQHPRRPTELVIDESHIEPALPTETQEGLFTADGLKREAARCLRCDCDACFTRCDLMRHYKKLPRRIVDEVDGTVNPGAIFSNRIATRLIASCEMCGACTVSCPKGVDMQRFLLESRRRMVDMGDMPRAFSAFWLEDMRHADTVASLESGSCTHVYFPGCQLGASDGRYVTASFEALRKRLPDAGIMLGCCGAPARWSGDRRLEAEKLADLRQRWEALGRPVVIFACPTCKKTFERHLPEVKGEYIFSYIEPAPREGVGPVSLFDPCASRGQPDLRREIRRLMEGMGLDTTELAAQGEELCCSFGGQTEIANPAMARAVAKSRAELSPNPYVTYCTNCRDIFARGGKPAAHIFDLLFGLSDFGRKPPTWSQRRRNREELKREMQEILSIPAGEPRHAPVKLYLSDQLRDRLDADYTLEEEAAATIAYCEATGRKIEEVDGAFTGHLRIGHKTHWVRYIPEGDGFRLLASYGHRMDIKGDENREQ